MAGKNRNTNRKNINKKNTDSLDKSGNMKNKSEYDMVMKKTGSENTGIDDIDIFDGVPDIFESNRDGSEKEIKEIKEIDISKKIDKRDQTVVKNLRRVINSKHREEKETTMAEDIEKNKVLWIILGILFVVLIIALIATNANTSKNKENSQKDKGTTTQTAETTTEENEDELVEEPTDSKITELVRKFLKAQRIDVSIEEVSKYVDNTDKISVAEYEKLKKYIEEYQNVTCYKLSSTVENTYIVITTYGCKFYNIETAAPGFEAFMVVENDGNYLIHNLTVEENLDTYISRDVDVTRINQLMKEINDSLESAKESDSDLAAVMNELSSIEKSTNE